MARFFISLVFLVFAFCAMLSSFAFGDIVVGTILSAAILIVFRGFLFGGTPRPVPNLLTRIVYLPVFVGASVWDILKGTVEVVAVAVHLRPLERPGIVAVPIGERSRVGLAVSAIQTTLSPGTYLVDVDAERGVWLVHALDASDPDAVRKDREDFYEKYQRKVFP